MRYFWCFFWTFCLTQMLFYVTSSMSGVAFDFQLASILSVVFTIFIVIISMIIPKDSTYDNGAH